jgi:hypothetical protein
VAASDDKPSEPSPFRPGLYEHYKGGQYIALNLVRHHETNELFVVYVSLSHGTVSIREYATPGKDSWCDVMHRTYDLFDPTKLKGMPRFRFLREAV